MLNRLTALSAAVALIFFAPAALAKDRISFSENQSETLRPISGLGVKGGGSVTISAGNSYSVTVREGAQAVVLYRDGNSLSIECARPCRGNVRRVIDVTVPSDSPLGKLAIAGGGGVRVESGFDEVSSLSLAVAGGGSLDASALRGGQVSAAVTGGGAINLTFTGSLSAAVVGGGSITYDGDEGRVTKRTVGGGSIRPR